MKNSSSRTACELRAWKGKDAHAVSGELWGAHTVNGGMHRVEGWWARVRVQVGRERAHLLRESSARRTVSAPCNTFGAGTSAAA
jgi:hypothetical protein